MTHVVFNVNCADEQDMLKAISLIMGGAATVPAIPAPDGLTAADLEHEDIHSKPQTDEGVEGLSTADFWKQMVVAAERGSDVRNVREALGMTQTEFARRWGSTPANISALESKDGKLQHRSHMKLARLVAERIMELS